MLDGGAHFYDAYETADGKYISVGSIEPQFYALLLKHAEIDDPAFQNQFDLPKWPEWKDKISEVFKTKTRDQWCEIMEGTDVCFAPVLNFEDAINHPHNVARKGFVDIEGITQPAPSPRFSRTQPEIQGPPPNVGQHNESALKDWGFSDADVSSLKEKEVI